MNLIDTGNLLRSLRKSKKMTQKQLADKLGVCAKTVSKWETGHGFVDVSMLSELADILGVSERILLSGSSVKNKTDSGNMRNLKFYICPCCGSIMQGTGESLVVCCGNIIEPVNVKKSDENHFIKVSQIENDYYIEFDHEMTKEHYIKFIAHLGSDRVLAIRLYPEQAPYVRIPKMYKGKLYYYCSKHGMYEIKLTI